MNVSDLQTYASLLGVPVSLVVLVVVLYLFVIKPAFAWFKTDIMPRWLEAQEEQAKAMLNISKIVESLQYEVRESRRVSDANASTLARMDVRLGQWAERPANGRARKVGEP